MEYENQLIREVTQSLYSSLEIEKSLHESVLVLKKHFPINLIHVFVIDSDSKTLRYLAEATEKKGILIDEKINLSGSYIKELEDFSNTEIFVLESTKSPLLRMTNRHFLNFVKKPLFNEDSKFSVMILNFSLGSSTICGFGIVSKGTNVFKKEHFEKMKLIKKPVTGSVINLLNYRDLVCRNKELSTEKKELEKQLRPNSSFDVSGKDSGLSEVLKMISRVSHMNSPVLLTGETGTGKELAAHEIHRTSKRKNKKMISINCGAIPETLIDSELFGHEKGAFTGAEKLKRGYFEQADGGTIFLDEVGELPLSAQVKLLRVLQTMEFNRIGGNIPVSVDVRIIAATNRDLLHMVEKKSFREDLWFRLNVFPINIPPLRNRKQDIKGLVDYFIKIKAREMNIKNLPLLSEKDLRKLENYDWPGNVRELQNVVERALILGRGQYLGFENFNLLPVEEKTDKRIEKNTDLIKLDDLIKNHIKKTLEHTNCRINGKKGAAQILGINPSTLRSKMKKYNISIRKNT